MSAELPKPLKGLTLPQIYAYMRAQSTLMRMQSAEKKEAARSVPVDRRGKDKKLPAIRGPLRMGDWVRRVNNTGPAMLVVDAVNGEDKVMVSWRPHGMRPKDKPPELLMPRVQLYRIKGVTRG